MTQTAGTPPPVVYGIDTSSLAHVREAYPNLVTERMNNLIRLIQAGRLKTVPMVLAEFAGWEIEYAALKPHRKLLVLPDKPLMPIVSTLVSRYEGLVNSGRRANQSDPWIIAMGLHHGLTLVSNERVEHRRGRQSIPWICQQEGIPCINLEELARREGW